MTRQEVPYQPEHVRFVDQLSLTAAQSAVSTSRHFLRFALSKLHAALIEDDVLLVASELVTNAITITGVVAEKPTWGELERLDLVHVRLVGLRDSVVIEVWDVSSEPPVLRRAEDDAEDGRGLFLVRQLARRWGSFRAGSGKAVWAELGVRSPLPRRQESGLSTARPAVAGPAAVVLGRVLAGLDTAL
ncbi:ATP-binding protein [Streptomyces sp. CA-278952]|uniref:ATP-binding protein n=1 Tax=Streptomyces sp. CA-278952 TaxID=2980556 RepID=UPI002367E71A|nr:ATP-binding protein [Streptomyces sp. CA-278952]WDG29071.1 ATP-binding protein [Streptomyces sp. CA-278952]